MRNSRVNVPNRCYHLISRVAHRAYFLDDEERTRLVTSSAATIITKSYLRPLTEAGLIARTDPDHPNSPRQKYVLTKTGTERIRRVALP